MTDTYVVIKEGVCSFAKIPTIGTFSSFAIRNPFISLKVRAYVQMCEG
jgi:hypothetical protein